MNRPAWLSNRRVVAALAWSLLVVLIAVAVNIAGIHFIGSIDDWERWLETHTEHFFVWRLCLYSATAGGWWWMRKRLRQREPAAQSHQRLLRTEIAAVITLVLLEGSLLLRHG